MSITRLLALIRKEFIQTFRDPRSLTITFIMPLIQLFLLGYAATSDVRNVPLAVLDRDRSAASRDLLSAYRAADYYRIDFDVTGEAELKQLIDSGQAGAGLIIPPGYGDKVAAGQTAQVAFVVDGSDPTIAGTGLSAAQFIAQAKATSLLVQRAAQLGQGNVARSPIEIRTRSASVVASSISVRGNIMTNSSPP